MLRRVIVTALIALSACLDAPGGKAKVVVAESPRGTSGVDGVPGNWRLVRTVESAHPYANNLVQSLSVAGSAEALRLKVVLSRFELETGYDFLTVVDPTGETVERLTGIKTGYELAVTGAVVRLDLTTDETVTAWGYRADVYEELPCFCIALYNPVCGEDGQSYSNACAAACAGQPIAYDGACQTSWTRVGTRVESEHPYGHNLESTFTVHQPGAARLRLHFARIALENGYDVLTLRNGKGDVVTTYTGARSAFVTAPIDGDTVTLELTSDYIVADWGFLIDAYEWESLLGCRDDGDCGSGETCVQVQCIRAPCPALCQPVDVGPASVSLETLAADPLAYNERRVRLVAEPSAAAAACTKIFCPPENPCCNQCVASLVLGREGPLQVELLHADGAGFTCTGNSCEWGANCDSFMAERNGPYELVGRFVVGTNGAASLLVESYAASACRLTGCGATCANYEVYARCAFMPEYACYETAACVAQGDGHCGFTATPELSSCLEARRVIDVSAGGLPVVIPDDDIAGVRSSIAVDAPARVVESVFVNVRIRHTYRGDLTVSLTAPDGTTVFLHDHEGGSADDVEIAREVPELVGVSAYGNWTLAATDSAALDEGTLEAFSLVIR